MNEYVLQIIKDREDNQRKERLNKAWNAFVAEDAIGSILATQVKNQKNLAA